MMKLWHRLLVLFLSLLLMVMVLTGYFVARGYNRYIQAIRETPVEEAVANYPFGERIRFNQLSPAFVYAVVAVEDQRYFYRRGFDWVALFRAIINNLVAHRAVEGASTIGQQVAKNLYFQGGRRGLEEKLAEVFLMNELENQYSKEEVLALYVSMNYYGDGLWGIAQASKGYYQTSPAELDYAHAAMLAGIPNAPSYYQLSTGYEQAVRRQRKVLSRMKEEGYISEQEYEEALLVDVHPVPEGN